MKCRPRQQKGQRKFSNLMPTLFPITFVNFMPSFFPNPEGCPVNIKVNFINCNGDGRSNAKRFEDFF